MTLVRGIARHIAQLVILLLVSLAVALLVLGVGAITGTDTRGLAGMAAVATLLLVRGRR